MEEESGRVPEINKRSEMIAASRYEQVMSKTVVGRYRNQIIAEAAAKDGEEEARRLQDVYNYGDMLFQEAKLTQAKKDEWRRHQQAEKIRAEDEEIRQSQIGSRASRAGGMGGSVDDDEEVLDRFERLHLEKQNRERALRTLVAREEARQHTYCARVSSKKSRELTANYGDFLEEMKAREAEKAMRLRELRHRRREIEQGTNHPDVVARRTKGTSGQAWEGAARAGYGDARSGSASARERRGEEAREPAYRRLHETKTASYAQGFLRPDTSDPECTFQPNVKERSVEASAASERPGTLPRAHLEEVGDALYRDAHNRMIRRAMMDAQVDAELTDLRNESKLSATSEMLAARKLRREVAEIYAALGKEKSGLTYEEFGAAMVELGFLRYAHAEEALATTAFVEGGGVPAHARDEILMLQRIWTALVGPKFEGELLPANALCGLLQQALGVKEAATADPQQQGADVPSGAPEGGEGGEGGGAAGGVAASDPTLVADFAALQRATMSYRSTRNLKEARPEEASVVSDEECTFAPEIDGHSRKLAAKARGAGTARKGGKNRHEQLYARAARIDEKLEQKRIEKAEAEMAEVTFKPKVNSRSSTATGPGGTSMNAAAHKMGERRFHHLHRAGSAARKGEAVARGRGAGSAPRTTEEKELEHCTFKPTKFANYAPRRLQTAPAPPGYAHAVERLRRGNEEREQTEAYEEEAARKRAALLAKPVKPFSFLTSERVERKTPLLYMDVNLGPGRTGRIGLHEGDDPAELASNFALTYGLDEAMTGRLQQLIRKYLNDVLPTRLTPPAESPADASPAPSDEQQQLASPQSSAADAVDVS